MAVAVQVKSRTPYAVFVHPKGTPASQTIVNTNIIPEILPRLRVELIQDFIALKQTPAFRKAVRDQLIAGLGGGLP